MKPSLVFDLDGTISDPIEGIAESLNDALEACGYQPRRPAEFRAYIGPPLDSIFREITGEASEGQLRLFVQKYRERFSESGFAKNVLYDGVVSMIESLVAAGNRMGVCTSKREDFAVKILRRFKIDHLFDFVSGGDIGVSKAEQLEELLRAGKIGDDAVMIGDRAVDIKAATRNGLRSVGVTWGYGSPEELKAEAASWIVGSPQDLFALIDSW